MINLTIDGRSISAPKGITVYQAAIQQKIDIPIFCYQDRMPPFGACRVCMVEVEGMEKPQISCTLEAREGMVVRTQSEKAVKARKEILEFLLINHPLDCPICDRGGECPLQDNTLKYGPGISRFFEEKRRFKKPLPLSPVLMLDRERCIACARCTRFSEIISGDHALEFIDRGYRTEVGTLNKRFAESKFIGNTIMICPVGALTSDVYRFRARPWDNETIDSTCTLCPVGCRMLLDSRDGEIMRTRSFEDREVNDMWLCDKGWFGYEFAAHPDRLATPLIRRHDQLEPASWEEALAYVAAKIKESKPRGRIGAIGGNPLTVEENFLFQKFIREICGVNHIDHRVRMPILSDEEELLAAGMEITIGECEELSHVILLGLDLTEEFPVIWLRLRQAINKGAQVIFIGHYAPEISRYLNKIYLHPPGKEIETLRGHLAEINALAKAAQKGAIFIGQQYLHSPQRKELLFELLSVQQEFPQLSLNIMEGKENSLGARLAGVRPDRGPFEKKLLTPGLNALQILQEASVNTWDLLYVVGSNLAASTSSKLWKGARPKIHCLIVQDIFLTETAQQADVVFPTLSFLEKEGSFINIENRVQKLHPGKKIPQGIYSDGEIFKKLARYFDTDLLDFNSFGSAAKGGRIPLMRLKSIDKPPSEGLVDLESTSPRQLRATFSPVLFDRGVRMNHNLHLAQLVKEPYVRIHPSEGIRLSIPNGAKVRLTAKNCSLSTIVNWDKGVSVETVVIPKGFKELPIYEWEPNLINGTPVEISLL